MAADRRTFLLSAAAGVGLAAAPTAWFSALARTVAPGTGPYGALRDPDSNGIRLPAGFTSRIVGRTFAPVLPSAYVWHVFPDGGATYPTDDGGWIYVSNSEIPGGLGGAGAIRFAPDGEIVDAYRILEGTSTNCAGGPTPWGTWLSCEETETGMVWECDPTGAEPAVAHPAMGTFAHEAVAIDPIRRRLYLTEDTGDGRLYRFTPAAYPALATGLLEAASVAAGRVTWLAIPDPSAATTPTRHQVPATTPFDGGEGIWWDKGLVYFSTKGDNRIWVLDTATDTLTVLYDAAVIGPGAPLTGVDNIVVAAPSGDVFVAEDGGNLELVMITPEGSVAPFLQVTGQVRSELCGPAFNPDGDRLYFSSQRGGILPAQFPDIGQPGSGFGLTYEVTGPFRRMSTVPAESTPTTIANAGNGGGSATPPGGELPATGGMGVGLGGAAALGLAAAIARLRSRASSSRPPTPGL